jgi:hypothetical protein
MRSLRLPSFSLASLGILMAAPAFAADAIIAPTIVAPVIQGGTYHPSSTLVGGGYFYGGFSSQLQALDNERQLAAAELALVDRRVDSFRPFRSFHRYAATYFVDQAWQIEQLAARQQLQCLDLHEANLWRQRRAVAEALAVRGQPGNGVPAEQQ